MPQSKSAFAIESRKKVESDEKTFRIPVSTGIFEHCPEMLESIWLFLWYIDRTTEEKDGEGRVLGGMPIIDAKPANTLRVPVKTIRRWRVTLTTKGYIRTLRTPYGYVVTLPKSKKWDWKPRLVPIRSDSSPSERDLPSGEISRGESARNGKRDLPEREHRLPDSGRESARIGKYKEDKTAQNRDEAVDETVAAAAAIGEKHSKECWREIGLAPLGNSKFIETWERIWNTRSVSECVAGVMERCIVACQVCRVSIPGPFYRRKHELEREAKQPNEFKFPRLEIPD